MRFLTVLVIGGAIALGYYLYDPFTPDLVSGKRVVITGASMGIGEQMAYQYARLGAQLMIVARSEDRLMKVIENCRNIGRKDGVYLYHVADLSNPEHTKQVIQVAEKGLGGIDYLVLNHIISQFGQWEGSGHNMTRLRDTMELNFFAYAQLASDALPVLERSRGSIVVMSSLAGRTGQMYVIPYSTSKYALDGFFSGLRLEQTVRNTGITITLCIVGLVDTESAMKSLKDSGFEKMLNLVQAAKASDVAYDIVRGAALKQHEIYTPYLPVNFGLFLHFLSPKLQTMLTMYIWS